MRGLEQMASIGRPLAKGFIGPNDLDSFGKDGWRFNEEPDCTEALLHYKYSSNVKIKRAFMFGRKWERQARKEHGYLWWLMKIKRTYKQFDVEWVDSLTKAPLTAPRLLEGCISNPPCIFNAETIEDNKFSSDVCPSCNGTITCLIQDSVLTKIAQALLKQPVPPEASFCIRFREQSWARISPKMRFTSFEWRIIEEAVSSCNTLSRTTLELAKHQEGKLLGLPPSESQMFFLMDTNEVWRLSENGSKCLTCRVQFEHENKLIQKWTVVALDGDLLVGYSEGSLFLCELQHYKKSNQRYQLRRVMECEQPRQLCLIGNTLLAARECGCTIYHNITYDFDDSIVFPIQSPATSQLLLSASNSVVEIWTAENSIVVTNEQQEVEVELEEKAVLASYAACIAGQNLLMLSKQQSLPSFRVDLHIRTVQKLNQKAVGAASQISYRNGLCRYIDQNGRLHELLFLE